MNKTKEAREAFYKKVLEYLAENPTATNDEIVKEFGYKHHASASKVLWRLSNRGLIECTTQNGVRCVEVLEIPEHPNELHFKTEWQREEYANIYTSLKELFDTCTDVKLLNAKAQIADLAMKALSRT